MNAIRMEIIVNELSVHKNVNVSKLAEKCGVSSYTIRRDLSYLEKQGLISRSYGYATLANNSITQQTYLVRKHERIPEKQLIGELGADLVRDGDTLYLAPSSTVSYMLPFLNKKKDLTIITNGLQIALDCLSQLRSPSVFFIGGSVDEKLLGTVGTKAFAQFEQFRTDICFFSPKGLSPEGQVLCWNAEIAAILNQAVRISRKTALLCTSNKFGAVNNHVICNLHGLDYIVTEKQPNEQWLKLFQDSGMETIWPGN